MISLPTIVALAAACDIPSITSSKSTSSSSSSGAADSAIFLLSWLDSGVIDGGCSSIGFLADVNFDKTIDENDLANCLASSTSFSCGNLVPGMLKETGGAEIIGTQTGGGACSVKISGLADGTIFQFSSKEQLCMTKNGSYYDIDQGVAPDYYLSDYDAMYGGTLIDELDSGDRANIVEYINNL